MTYRYFFKGEEIGHQQAIIEFRKYEGAEWADNMLANLDAPNMLAYVCYASKGNLYITVEG